MSPRVARDASQPSLWQVHLIHGEMHDELGDQGFHVLARRHGRERRDPRRRAPALPRGVVSGLGEVAAVEVTGLRNPCVQLDHFQPGLMAAGFHRDDEAHLVRAGVMAVVVTGGYVRSGGNVAVEVSPPPYARLAGV
jgi:hypothetical protein